MGRMWLRKGRKSEKRLPGYFDQSARARGAHPGATDHAREDASARSSSLQDKATCAADPRAVRRDKSVVTASKTIPFPIAGLVPDGIGPPKAIPLDRCALSVRAVPPGASLPPTALV